MHRQYSMQQTVSCRQACRTSEDASKQQPFSTTRQYYNRQTSSTTEASKHDTGTTTHCNQATAGKHADQLELYASKQPCSTSRSTTNRWPRKTARRQHYTASGQVHPCAVHAVSAQLQHLTQEANSKQMSDDHAYTTWAPDTEAYMHRQ